MPGSEERFAALYRAHYRHVSAYSRRRVSADQTDDLVADIFMAAWRHIDAAPDGDRTLPWLYRIAFLTASNHWRRLKRSRQLRERLEKIGPNPTDSVDEQIVRREEVDHALGVLGVLSRADQEIIKLSVWEQLSSSEIAVVLDISPEAVRQRLHRAKKRLAGEYRKRHENTLSPPLLGKEVSGEH